MTTTTLMTTLEQEQIADRILGRILQTRRQELTLTLEELARITGVSIEELKDHESGAMGVPAGRLPHLAKALSLTTAELFRWSAWS